MLEAGIYPKADTDMKNYNLDRRAEVEEQYFSALNTCLYNADLPATDCGIDLKKLPVVYSVGAPRSGTTFLGQVISAGLNIGYINNLIARFWDRPSVGINLSNRLLPHNGRDMVSFVSTQGRTSEIGDIHEFGYFWSKWLKLDSRENHHGTAGESSELDIIGLGNAIRNEILQSFGKPVSFRNIICGFHADLLSAAHARSYFVCVERDDIDVAMSIYKCRMERFGNANQWWSLKPSTYPFAGVYADNPVCQIAKQVFDCKREMREELTKVGGRVLYLDYKELCESPIAVLDRLCDLVGDSLARTDVDFKDIVRQKPSDADADASNAAIQEKFREAFEILRTGV